jgi:hypothetical protein
VSDSSNRDIVLAAATTASNVLGSNSCNATLADVQALMRRILALQATGSVAGESASTIETQQITAVIQRAFQQSIQVNGTSDTAGSGDGGDGGDAGSGGSFHLPSLSDIVNGTYDLSVVRYSNISQCLSSGGSSKGPTSFKGAITAEDCYALDDSDADGELILEDGDEGLSPSASIVSDLTTAEVIDGNGTVHDVHGLSGEQTINFTIPVDSSKADPSRVRCSWWDPSLSKWRTAGCVTTHRADTPNLVYCSCTHLTGTSTAAAERTPLCRVCQCACTDPVRCPRACSFSCCLQILLCC